MISGQPIIVANQTLNYVLFAADELVNHHRLPPISHLVLLTTTVALSIFYNYRRKIPPGARID